jgi:hypothetical protein
MLALAVMHNRHLRNMKSFLTVTIILLAISQCFGQRKKHQDKETEKEPKFATEGEHAAYMTEKLFETQYKKKKHKRFKGQITRLDSETFMFDEVVVKVTAKDEHLQLLFQEGILFPWTTRMRVGLMQQLPNFNPSHKVKRFELMVHELGLANPFTYFIELTNENATETMDLTAFIKGSTLTFLKQGWLMI